MHFRYSSCFLRPTTKVVCVRVCSIFIYNVFLIKSGSTKKSDEVESYIILKFLQT